MEDQKKRPQTTWKLVTTIKHASRHAHNELQPEAATVLCRSFKHYCWNAQIKEPQNVTRQFRTLRWVSVSSERHVFLLKINVLQHHDGLEIKETNLGKSFDNYTTKLAAAWDLQKLAKRQQTSKTTWQICEQMGWLVNEWTDGWTDTSLQDGKDTNMGTRAALQTDFLQVNVG